MPRVSINKLKYKFKDDCQMVSAGLREKKISQTVAAEEFNITQQGLSYKLNHNPSYWDMLKLCDLLGWEIVIVRKDREE